MEQTSAVHGNGDDDRRDISVDADPATDDGVGASPGAEPQGGPTAVAALRRSLAALGGGEAAVLVAVVAFTVVRSTAFTFSTTPRMALLALVGVPGLVLLVRAAVRRHAGAALLIGFVAAAVVSALLSGNAVHSLKGESASSGTVLAWGLALGWCGVGLHLGRAARTALPWALAVGAILNGLVGLAQLAFSIQRGPLATFAGRASGLMDNPVYYGSFLAGVAAWAVVRASAVGGRNAIVLAAVMAYCMGLSGSRASTVALVVVTVLAVAGFRCRPALFAALAAGVGIVGASFTVSALGTSSRGALNRFESGEGIGARTGIWRYGLEAFGDRPLFGWGMNRFGAATWPRYSLEFVRDTAWNDQSQPWTDPHNVVVYLLATVGIVGVLILLAALAFLLRRGVEPALGAFVLGAAITWLLQPTSLHVLPIVAMVLGAASRVIPPSPAAASSPSVRAARLVPLVVGGLLCAYFLVADFRLSRAIDAGDLERIESTASWYIDDPLVTELVASRADVAAATETAEPSVAVTWAEQTLALVPEDPRAYGWLALRQFRAGDPDGMGRSLEAGFEVQAWNPNLARLAMLHAIVTEDVDAAAAAAARVCEMELDVCEQAQEDAAVLAEFAGS